MARITQTVTTTLEGARSLEFASDSVCSAQAWVILCGPARIPYGLVEKNGRVGILRLRMTLLRKTHAALRMTILGRGFIGMAEACPPGEFTTPTNGNMRRPINVDNSRPAAAHDTAKILGVSKARTEELIREARRIIHGDAKTGQLVIRARNSSKAAADERVKRRRRERILDAFGSFEFDPAYDYKAERGRKRR